MDLPQREAPLSSPLSLVTVHPFQFSDSSVALSPQDKCGFVASQVITL